MKNKISIIFFVLAAMFIATSCTDLDETFYDQLTPDQFQPDDTAPVGIVYSILRGSPVVPYTYPGSEFVWFIQTSTDEVCVPIKTGGDWKDDYVFQEMQKHTWTGNNKVVLSAWNYCFDIIGACNVELSKPRYSLNQQAQIRLVRAYAYMMAMDMFGNVPVVIENHQGAVPQNSTRKQVFDFVESELNDLIMDNLRFRRTSEVWGKSILYTLRARLYLNSNVYLGGNTPLADSDDSYKANLAKVIANADSVTAMNRFAVTDYFKSFYVDNDLAENSSDIICALEYKPTEGTIGNFLQLLGLARGVQYALGIPVLASVVNGPVVNPGKTADDEEALYNLFDANDIRRLSMIAKQLKYVYEFDANGQPYEITDKPYYMSDLRWGGGVVGDLLTCNPFFTGGFSPWNGVPDNPNAANRGDGARMMKYEMVTNQAWEMANNLVLMRYTEVLYMKAEALIRLNRGGEATSIFNEVLAKRGYDGSDFRADSLASKRFLENQYEMLNIPVTPTLDFMEKEWRREFVFENRRRSDMIRFDKFLGTWGLKAEVSQPYKRIFPIPTDILNRNPNMKQNPGYDGYDGWLD